MIPPHAKKVFEGILFDVYQWEQELFDGTTAIFEKLLRGNGVTVIPVLPDGRLIIEMDEQPGREEIVTFPSGRVEKGEAMEVAAERELLEETGYKAQELIPWEVTSPSSKIEWEQHYFIGRNCEKIQEQHLDGGERIKVFTVSFEEALDYADNPLFRNNGIAIQFMKAKYDEAARAELKKLFYGT